MVTFLEQSKPVIEEYEKDGKVKVMRVDASEDIETVWASTKVQIEMLAGKGAKFDVPAMKEEAATAEGAAAEEVATPESEHPLTGLMIKTNTTMTEQEVAESKVRRKGRRMSQMERDVGDIFSHCNLVKSKHKQARRKSIDLREDAAGLIGRLSSLLDIGETIIALAASN